jgi:deoxyribonuclease IV
MTLAIGSHVERTDPLGGAHARNAEVIQINLSSPRSWRAPSTRGDEETLAASDMDIFVHSPYLINPASIRAEQRDKSRQCLEEQSRAAAQIGATGLVVHGGHPTGGGTVADGINGWLEVLSNADLPCRILIENTAGGNAAVARHLDALEKLFAAIRGAGHDVGFVLDTCHAHAGGMNLDGLVARLIDAVGEIDLVHVNDSKDTAGCGRDRHETLGQGLIPHGAIAEIVGAANAPAVVETPGAAENQAADITWLRQRLS